MPLMVVTLEEDDLALAKRGATISSNKNWEMNLPFSYHGAKSVAAW